MKWRSDGGTGHLPHTYDILNEKKKREREKKREGVGNVKII